MSRSLKTSKTGSQQARQALKTQGFETIAGFWEYYKTNVEYISRVTLSNFFNCKPVERAIFEEICHQLDLDPDRISDLTVYVERSPIEQEVCQEIKKNGALIRIKGLKQTGKTWLLEKIIVPKAQQENYATVSLSFNSVNTSYLTDIEKLLQWLCNAIRKELGLNLNLKEYWDEYDTPNGNATNYLERVLEKLQKKALLLAFDDVDCVFDYLDTANDFCKLLRYWHDQPSRNNRKSELWKQLRLVILHSTERYAELDINSSPLAGVGRDFNLDEFNLNQAKVFIKQYGLNWSDDNINKLVQLVGGHPYLIDRACQECNKQNITPDELLAQAYTESVIYRDHLRELLVIIEEKPDLKAEFSKVIKSSEPVRLNFVYAFQLERMGLVELEGDLVSPRCELYRKYFSSRL